MKIKELKDETKGEFFSIIDLSKRKIIKKYRTEEDVNEFLIRSAQKIQKLLGGRLLNFLDIDDFQKKDVMFVPNGQFMRWGLHCDSSPLIVVEPNDEPIL